MPTFTRRSTLGLFVGLAGLGAASDANAEAPSVTSLAALASSGASFILDADAYGYTALSALVAAATKAGGTVTIRKAGKLALGAMAPLARSGVTFEF